jgi:hypothetical protein
MLVDGGRNGMKFAFLYPYLFKLQLTILFPFRVLIETTRNKIMSLYKQWGKTKSIIIYGFISLNNEYNDMVV